MEKKKPPFPFVEVGLTLAVAAFFIGVAVYAIVTGEISARGKHGGQYHALRESEPFSFWFFVALGPGLMAYCFGALAFCHVRNWLRPYDVERPRNTQGPRALEDLE